MCLQEGGDICNNVKSEYGEKIERARLFQCAVRFRICCKADTFTHTTYTTQYFNTSSCMQIPNLYFAKCSSSLQLLTTNKDTHTITKTRHSIGKITVQNTASPFTYHASFVLALCVLYVCSIYCFLNKRHFIQI